MIEIRTLPGCDGVSMTIRDSRTAPQSEIDAIVENVRLMADALPESGPCDAIANALAMMVATLISREKIPLAFFMAAIGQFVNGAAAEGDFESREAIALATLAMHFYVQLRQMGGAEEEPSLQAQIAAALVKLDRVQLTVLAAVAQGLAAERCNAIRCPVCEVRLLRANIAAHEAAANANRPEPS